ncbi:MAG: type II toxin-antitoxin system PemK/MazF family toxin [Chloroflexi bacterium]|nr:type II toxin-antitoxin system PemK/MazF family toxin [Chloroflexota bacterium]
MIWPHRGEIWSVLTPGRPEDPHQPRPALVVSSDVRNRSREHAVVIPIYSEGVSGPTRVPIPAGEGGLRHGSVLFCEEVTTLDRQFFQRGPWGDKVGDDVMTAVLRAVRRALGEVLPEG